MTLTPEALKKIQAVSGELPVLLMIIDHPDLPDPVRMCQSGEDISHQGETYIAIPFEIKPPEDKSQGLGRGQLSVSNVGKPIMSWIEMSQGGFGSTVTLKRVMRDTPDTVQWQLDGLILSNVSADQEKITGQLGWEDLLGLPAVAVRYNPENQPGIF